MIAPTLGSFTTILQLSVGANLTFSTVLSLFDNPLSKEKRAVEQLEGSGEKLVPSQLTADEANAVTQIGYLKSSVEAFSSRLEGWTYRWFRPTAAICALIAAILLVVATYKSSGSANLSFQILTFMTVLPLFSYSTYALISTTINVADFESKRGELNDVILKAIVRQKTSPFPAE